MIWQNLSKSEMSEYTEYAKRFNEYVREHINSCSNNGIGKEALKYAVCGSRFENII